MRGLLTWLPPVLVQFGRLQSLQMRKALIVEDEIIIAIDLCEMLEAWGWTVAGPARDAETGIRLAERDRPDVAIVDVQFVKGRPSGIDVAAVLQGEMGVPVIYLSGLSDEKLAYTARFTQPFALLKKPFAEKDLRLVLARALRGPEAIRARASWTGR